MASPSSHHNTPTVTANYDQSSAEPLMQRSNSKSTENLTSMKRNRPYLIFEKIRSLHDGDIIKLPPFGTVRLTPVE